MSTVRSPPRSRWPPAAARATACRDADPVMLVAGPSGPAVVLAASERRSRRYPPDEISLLSANAGISGAHLLGTDALGRDNLLAAALRRAAEPARPGAHDPRRHDARRRARHRRVDRRLRSTGRGPLLDLLFAFPGLLVAIIAVAVFGPGPVAPVVALSLAYTPYIARVLRAVAVRERTWPTSSRAALIGYSGWTICTAAPAAERPALIRAQATIAFGRPWSTWLRSPTSASASSRRRRVGNHGRRRPVRVAERVSAGVAVRPA